MGFWYWFRVAIMTAGLVVSILCIRALNRVARPVLPRETSLLEKVNLCPTRVSRLQIGRVSIFQEDLSWFRDDAAKRKEKLNDVAVEKWFARNCVVTGTRVASPPQVAAAMIVQFVSGEPRTLLKSIAGKDSSARGGTRGAGVSGDEVEYEWMGLPFRSEQLDRALLELTQLPAATSVSASAAP